MFHPVVTENFETLQPVEARAAISVVGLGYVGAVSMGCLAGLGHRVVGVDLSPARLAAVAAGRAPLHEAGLDELLARGVAQGLVSATADLAAAVLSTDVTFVSVGTPTAADGGCDLSQIRAVGQAIGRALAEKPSWHLVVMRCSVPPGTTMEVLVPALEAASGKTAGVEFGVCFNPEFLREGQAVADFHAPPKTVIGASDQRAAMVLARILERVDGKILMTSVPVAEAVKYADNVWHATKVAFANEIGRFCKPLGIDSHAVMDIFVQDTKLNISPYYLRPGFAYGGSCLPKEVRAMAWLGEKLGISLPLIDSLERSNRAQVDQALAMLRATGARRVAVLGLAFKPGTDDLRESPILEVIAALESEGVEILAHDPALPPGGAVQGLDRMLVDDPAKAVRGADAVIVTHATELYRKAVAALSKPVVDVTRLFRDRADQPAGLVGIGW